MTDRDAVPKTVLRVAVGLSATFLAIGVGAFIYAAGFADRDEGMADGPNAVHVTVTATACEPAALTVPAGPLVVQITNRSERSVEWEILDGVMVVAERENIAPGMTQRLATQLRPGRYAMICGLLSNPRGTLVAENTEKTATDRSVSLIDFVGPMAEYRVFLLDRLGALRNATAELELAASAGRAEAASRSLDDAVSALRQIAPALDRADGQASLSTSMDAAADALGRADMGGVHQAALALRDGAAALAARWDSQMPMPDRALEGALLTAGGDAASGQALSPDELAGLRKILDLLRPLLAEVDPSLAASVQADLSALDRASAAGTGLHDAKMALVRDLGAMRTVLRVEGDGTEP